MSTMFNYDLSPYGVVKGENVTFTLTITNPFDGKKQDNISISLQIDKNLTSNSSDIHPSSKSKNWTNVAQSTSGGEIFVIQPNDDVSLDAGESVQFSFSNVAITDNDNIGKVALIEQVAGETNSAEISVLKLQPKLDIVGYANPINIGKGQSTTLFFTSNAASRIKVEPIGKTIFTQAQGNGQTFSTSLEVTPKYQSGDFYQQIYTLTAYNDAGDYAPCNIAVTINPPQIDDFNAAPVSGVSLDDDSAVTFSWKTRYSNVTYLQPEFGGPIQVANNGHQTFNGKQLKQFIGSKPNQSSLKFTLVVSDNDGYSLASKPPVTIGLADAKILYFKFQNPDLTHPIYATSNAVTAVMEGTAQASYTFSVNGPGGPLEQYLGGATDVPQIQYFSPNKKDIQVGDKVTLSWVVQQISKMTFNPGGIDAPIDAEGKGSIDVTVDKDTTYVLTSQSGLSSTLSIKVSGPKSSVKE